MRCGQTLMLRGEALRVVIAEGVESAEHGKALLELGCELAQGFGIAKPMPAERVPEWIEGWKPQW